MVFGDWKSISVAIALGACFPTPSAAADINMRVCFGDEQPFGCPVSADAMFGCDRRPEDTFKEICSKIENGQRIQLPYRAAQQGNHSGGACGYSWYQLTCIGG
ncbi:hypothetical protein ELI24_09870 [Rhizobium ruizarguesonis]|jgi:hypothetical protein|uniref:hypothetical protein n=1 Tax=Rhizobium ruizarguesonis TaxID=2081791 RepID=UPI00103277CE|nr:hypothetical protein [Rhizobium ruizarguesonis]NEJ95347.1 hypothetical protein [Rhizobium ruizarguesonis]TAV98658.1 hypothetical protein ELI24_09870 [Rhizobium ruizarguesonis]